MRLLALILIAGIGAAVSAWGLHRGGRAARIGAIAGVVALFGVTAAAFALRPGRIDDVTREPVTGLFDAHLVATGYLRLIIGLWGLESIVLVGVAWLLGGLARLRGLLPATLAAITGGTVALASADIAVGFAAGAATGLAALVITVRSEGPAAVAATARDLRISIGGGAVLLGCLAVLPIAGRLAGAGAGSDAIAGSAIGASAIGLVAVVTTLVVAARWGVLPFHLRVSRLADLVPPETLPLLLAWVALPLTVVAIAMVDQLVTPLGLPLGGERALLVAIALGSMVGGALAALFHDDLRHCVAYVVVAEAGLLVLAIAAFDPAAWGAGRSWIVVLAASKTALLAWAAVTEDRFGTRSLPDLRGWARRSPFLAVGLVLTAIATIGLPGWIAYESRTALASLGAGAPWDVVLVFGSVLTLPVYGRLLVVGVGQPTSRVDRAAPEWVAPAGRTWRLRSAGRGTSAGSTTVAGTASMVATGRSTTDTSGRSTRLGGSGSAGQAVIVAVRRDRTQLLSAGVVTLAVLAVLTSWGVLDLGAAAAEPAPILGSASTD